ncbi:hypothetical protein HYW75_05375 [Candidatus Pacearchaeota archaeon]|nr:hypothetical protein [Candidatus Pacearchaeota archaeon]
MSGYNLFRKGKRLFDAGRFEEAEKPLYNFLVENPRHIEARNYLATIYASQRKASKARRLATKTADLSNGEPSGLVSAASMISDLDPDKSIQILEDALRECNRRGKDKDTEADIRRGLAKAFEVKGNHHKSQDERKIADDLTGIGGPPRGEIFGQYYWD